MNARVRWMLVVTLAAKAVAAFSQCSRQVADTADASPISSPPDVIAPDVCGLRAASRTIRPRATAENTFGVHMTGDERSHAW